MDFLEMLKQAALQSAGNTLAEARAKDDVLAKQLAARYQPAATAQDPTQYAEAERFRSRSDDLARQFALINHSAARDAYRTRTGRQPASVNDMSHEDWVAGHAAELDARKKLAESSWGGTPQRDAAQMPAIPTPDIRSEAETGNRGVSTSADLPRRGAELGARD